MSLALVIESPSNRSGSYDDHQDVLPPIRPVPLSDSPPEGAPVPETAGRVLVVDDHPGMRETLRELLEQHGYEVIEAREGEEALFLLAQEQVDVIILDLAMPGHDGLWVLDHLDPPMPRVIVHSAFEYVTTAEVRARAGSKVFRCLRKPVGPPELLAAVAHAMSQNPQ